MGDGQRHSIAADATLISDPDEIARREAENAVAQFDRMLDMVDEIARGSRPFRLRTSMILDLHRIALSGLSAYAGNFRPSDIEIGQSKHIPPQAHLVPALIEEMCEYVTENAETSEALHLCAYVMWKLNWIHPFTDGNGRTSRALAYYVLCGKLGYLLPGRETVPEQIAADRAPYYQALEDADLHFAKGDLNLSSLEVLLDKCLATQLLSAYNDAKNPSGGSVKDRKLH